MNKREKKAVKEALEILRDKNMDPVIRLIAVFNEVIHIPPMALHEFVLGRAEAVLKMKPESEPGIRKLCRRAINMKRQWMRGELADPAKVSEMRFAIEADFGTPEKVVDEATDMDPVTAAIWTVEAMQETMLVGEFQKACEAGVRELIELLEKCK